MDILDYSQYQSNRVSVAERLNVQSRQLYYTKIKVLTGKSHYTRDGDIWVGAHKDLAYAGALGPSSLLGTSTWSVRKDTSETTTFKVTNTFSLGQQSVDED